MQKRGFIAFLLASTVVAGVYTYAQNIARSQSDAVPFKVGETIWILYDSLHQCRVEEIQSMFVKCQNQPGAKRERWFNLISARGFEK